MFHFSIRQIFLTLITLQILSLITSPGSEAWASEHEALCKTAGEWLIPSKAGGLKATHSTVFEEINNVDFVLLGEQHDQAQHHRWQTQMLSALLSHRDQIAIGLEMLPKSSQSTLDAWVNGQLSVKDFLANTGWYETWRFDVELYMPILNFARENRVPLYALNVPREVISKISSSGWDADMTELTKPADASQGYRSLLKEVFQYHEGSDEKQLEFFIQAQLTWDRAFAEGLKAARDETSRLIVGIIGSGHLTYGFGVKRQLNAIGQYNVFTWIPTNIGSSCKSLDLINDDGDFIADAVFLTSGSSVSNKKHKLGLFLIDGKTGVVVGDVLDNSIAKQSGFQTNDMIIEAAGQPVADSGDLIAIIQNQTPGYWLPIKIKRNDEIKEILAKIPAQK
ncbi:MAG: ChaN family lipoprotein [Burkholderiales bacterium]|nr:ChaN family lipoprotein [Burkholderiales bacterium]OUT78781.1 MAG: hypothetical protein CBB82_02825 [Betaproteobacteria bacterium TMED22]|tara:strand:+ start:44668 stop:45849 length:1182 start_codon:yes stop_codon:yes gene_type:complete